MYKELKLKNIYFEYIFLLKWCGKMSKTIDITNSVPNILYKLKLRQNNLFKIPHTKIWNFVEPNPFP